MASRAASVLALALIIFYGFNVFYSESEAKSKFVASAIVIAIILWRKFFLLRLLFEVKPCNQKSGVPSSYVIPEPVMKLSGTSFSKSNGKYQGYIFTKRSKYDVDPTATKEGLCVSGLCYVEDGASL